MAQGTHLYFDHPYEPDPEERGLYWACRFCDTKKTFGFMPDNIYANADVKLTGDPICMEDLLSKNPEDHDPLKKHENILGIENAWELSSSVSSSSILFLHFEHIQFIMCTSNSPSSIFSVLNTFMLIGQ